MKKLSDYQLAIIDIFENTRKNICVSATAGSGKTFILKELAKRAKDKKSVFMAFNKSIADELREQLPVEVECSTFHSKMLRILLSNLQFRPKIDENKTFVYCKQHLKVAPDEIDNINRYFFDLQTIWNFVRLQLYVGTKEEIEGICKEKNIFFESRMVEDIETLRLEWEKSTKKIRRNDSFVIDFTDMLYLTYTLIDPIEFPKYDIVYIDESQDVSTVQRELFLQLLKPKGRFVAVGDEKQTIYVFLGGDKDNFSLLQRLPNTVTLPLSITYRCAKRIVEEAHKVFPEGIEASPTAEEGIVREGDFLEAQSGDFVLCRNNLPLVEAFLSLLERKKKATIKGKDFGDALLKLIEKVYSLHDIDMILDEKLEKLKEKGLSEAAATRNPSYVALQEKCQILILLWRRFKGERDKLKDVITSTFTEKTEGIVLCTCHKAKGLEADKVFFLNPQLIPSEYAVTEKALYAERCLKFVAITRAKKELIYCKI